MSTSVKQWLGGYVYLDTLCKAYLAELEWCGHVRTSAKNLSVLARYKKLIQEHLCEVKRQREVIFEVVHDIRNEQHRAFLNYRYLHGLTLEKTADAMHYCTKHIQVNIQPKALEAVQAAIAAISGYSGDPKKGRGDNSKKRMLKCACKAVINAVIQVGGMSNSTQNSIQSRNKQICGVFCLVGMLGHMPTSPARKRTENDGRPANYTPDA